MPSIASPRGLWIAAGFPQFQAVPNPQYLVGKDSTPLAIQVTLANATAMATDLTARGSWFTSPDRRVPTAYSISSAGDTSRLNAILSICAVGLRIVTFSDTTSNAASVAKLLSAGSGPYLSGTIGGVPFRQGLARGISHYVKRVDASQAVAADEVLVTLDQGYAVLPQPIRLNLMTDALSLVSDAAVALGADAVAHLELIGTLVPADADAGWNTFYAGASCSGGGQDSAPIGDGLGNVRAMNMSFAQANVKF